MQIMPTPTATQPLPPENIAKRLRALADDLDSLAEEPDPRKAAMLLPFFEALSQAALQATGGSPGGCTTFQSGSGWDD